MVLDASNDVSAPERMLRWPMGITRSWDRAAWLRLWSPQERWDRGMGDEYAWMVETSGDGVNWVREQHPAGGFVGSGGVEAAGSPAELASRVHARRAAALVGDERYDWSPLWARVTVWDHAAAADSTAADEPPLRPERMDPTGVVGRAFYGLYLQVLRVEPVVVDVRAPHEVALAVLSVAAASGADLSMGDGGRAITAWRSTGEG